MIPKENIELIINDTTPSVKNSKRLRIIHFNDVYNIEGCGKSKEFGGAARFKTVLKSLTKHEPAIVLFSGDAISPSTSNLINFRVNSKVIMKKEF
jgi:2',3'-cyclic-nucleotide 2'-phosphodiesterase (5'-nucleotidase family)